VLPSRCALLPSVVRRNLQLGNAGAATGASAATGRYCAHGRRLHRRPQIRISNANYTSTDDIATDPFLLQQLTLAGDARFCGHQDRRYQHQRRPSAEDHDGGTLELSGNLSQVGPDDLVYNVRVNTELAATLTSSATAWRRLT